MSLTCLSPVGTRERHERVVVVVLRARGEGVAVGTEVDDRLATARYDTAHVSAWCEGHEELVDARLDLEGLAVGVGGVQRDGAGLRGKVHGPESILILWKSVR